MIEENVRVFVNTNTNVKFVASLPSTLTIRSILPILIKKYDTVVRQNFDQEEYNLQELKANKIRQITKNGYFIPLDEEVNSILTNDDSIFLQTKFYEDQKQSKFSKKEALEIKKSEKQIDVKHSNKNISNKKDEQVKIDQVIQKKAEIPISKEGQKGKTKTEGSLISTQNLNQLLSKIIRINKPINSPAPEKLTKAIIIQESDSQVE